MRELNFQTFVKSEFVKLRTGSFEAAIQFLDPRLLLNWKGWRINTSVNIRQIKITVWNAKKYAQKKKTFRKLIVSQIQTISAIEKSN